MEFFKKYIQKLIEKQNGGNYNKVLGAGEVFVATSHRISGVQFSSFPATITVAKTKDRKNREIDCIPLQAITGASEIVVPDNTYVFGHELGYTKFTCDKACTVNLVSHSI